MPIHRPWVVAVILWWDCIGSVPGIDVLTDCFGIVRFVTGYVAALDLNLAEQRDGVLGIVAITGTEQKSKRIAQAIHQSMNFRVSATSGYAYCLISRSFPLH